MPKNKDIQKILIIGSGPIVIGQAAEFDYAGTQACIALREEGYQVILANSNPATIMTDTHIADKVYMEPLTLEYIARIIRHERPDALLPSFGGQTGLNLAMQLSEKGVLKECQVKLLGTDLESIDQAEDRELFRAFCQKINEPVLPAEVAYNIEEAAAIAENIGYPIILRPAFTLGGTGGGFAKDYNELKEIAKHALDLSPVHQVLIEKSVKGYKEIEFEVMRDHNDIALVICCMENVDPVGVHTGDSIVVAPDQSLSPEIHEMLKNSALKIIRELKIAGGCNVQYALHPETKEYYLIEVNPRVSRSSALASKATAYPIAFVSAKIAVGMSLDEIIISGRNVNYEPEVNYTVVKFPRFPFDKFVTASNRLSTQMKATGEIMSIGTNFEEALLKGVRSLEIGADHLYLDKFDDYSTEKLRDYISETRDDQIFAIAELIRRGIDLKEIQNITKITLLFLEKIKKIIDSELLLENTEINLEELKQLKKLGFSDSYIAKRTNQETLEIIKERISNGIVPSFQSISTQPKEIGIENQKIPYFYSTYHEINNNIDSSEEQSEAKKILVLGSGPIRIGQGVEFDYSTVHAVWSIQKMGYQAIVVNNNPETVSTDYTISDKLYFEPLTIEDVMNVIEKEKPKGVIVTLGGQTAINLCSDLTALNVPILGTDQIAIEKAENRDAFEKVMQTLEIPQPIGKAVTDIDKGLEVAEKIGYPVLVRPSYVLGGRAMEIVSSKDSLKHYLKTAVEIDTTKPVLVDKYISGIEVEVDAVCDGENVFVPGIIQHIERTGIHSGDSISVYPAFGISDEAMQKIVGYTVKLGLEIGIIGLFNIQFIITERDYVYVIEVNPRSSRTVPFISKSSGYSLADIATKVMLGKNLREQGIGFVYPKQAERWYVKSPAFSFAKLAGADSYLSPEMKSTGEAIGYDNKLTRALYKALQASNMRVSNYGTVFVTIADRDKAKALPLIKRFYNIGFNIEATKGTAEFLKQNGIRTRARAKISEGSDEIIESIRQGHVTYVINTRNPSSDEQRSDGFIIRSCAAENNVTTFTALETVSVLLDVLEEITIGISTIDADKQYNE